MTITRTKSSGQEIPPESANPPALATLKVHDEIETIELDLLLEALARRYDYDFRGYARASLRRRVTGFMTSEKLDTISMLQALLLRDERSMERFLLALSVNVTSMFRDPDFFLAFRQKIVPLLHTYPFVRIWHAGCSSGEEVYSMAILLEEEGLLPRCRLYATDMNEAVLRQAREGIFPLTVVHGYERLYSRAGGKSQLSGYYTSAYGSAIFRSSLREKIIFSQHNLVADGSFNEFHVILCRNVLIYFNQELQNRVQQLLYDSLVQFGYLGLGSQESLKFSPCENDFEPVQEGQKLFRRIR